MLALKLRVGIWFRLLILAGLIALLGNCRSDYLNESSAQSTAFSETEAQTGRSALELPYPLRIEDASIEVVETLQREVVGALSGASSIDGSTKLKDRYSEANKALVRAYLVNKLGSYGLETHRHLYATGENIWTILPAVEQSKEYVVIGAHYDTYEGVPGAVDNATGISVMLALTKFFSEVAFRSRNLLVVFFDEEETGMIGSNAFILEVLQEGEVAKYPVYEVHTVDQLGWDADGDQVVEIEKPNQDLRERYIAAAEAIGLLGVPSPTDTINSDHQSFRRHRMMRTIGLSEEYVGGDTSPNVDTPKDTFDTVNFGFLARSTILIGRVVLDALDDVAKESK